MGMFTEAIEVTCTPAGVPLRVHWKGREYRLIAQPHRWFERRKWWEEGLRVPRGSGGGLADYEIWRLQLGLGLAAGDGVSVDVSFDPQGARWRLIRVHQELPASA